MKKYTTEMMKLLALAIITPILVAVYTKIESTVSYSPVDQTQGGVTGATPVSVGLLDNFVTKESNQNTIQNNDYIVVRSVVPANDVAGITNGKKPVLSTNGFALIVL
ncbi:MAG: hypothetical protein ABIT58_03070 [Ferruginibacter sp.]